MTLISFQSSHKNMPVLKSTILLSIIALSFSVFTSPALGAQINLSWNAVNNTNVAGYRLYYRTSGERYTKSVDAGRNTTCTVPNLIGGTPYFFVVTAYTHDNTESAQSNEVSYTIPAESSLSSITIDGSTQVNENSSTQYTCTAHYSDGSSANLTSGVSWSENSAAASINSSGVLTSGSVTADTAIALTATYNGRTDTHTVTIKNIPPALASITIEGPTQVSENSNTQYTCTAHYSDGTSAVLTSNVSWSDNSTAATVNSSGVLAAGSVTADTAVVLTAAYGGKTNTRAVTVKNIPPTLASIAIAGPIQVNTNSSAQYTCTAHYSDGSSANLTSGVSWSENASAATIDSSGKLTTGSVTSDTPVTVKAVYNGQTDTHSVTIQKSATTLASLSISGPSLLNEESSGQYVCTARYSDSSTSTVTDSVQWNVNSEFAAIDAAGYLVTRAVKSEQHVTITATIDGKQAGYNLIISDSKTNYTLNIDIVGSGTVLLDPPGGIYDSGTVVTLTAEADQAWAFDGWMGGVEETGAGTATVVMDSDMDVSATFLEDTDLDSVPDQEEWGSDSQDMNFDGNNDGIADYLQGSVASLHTRDYQHFITLSTMAPGRFTRCQLLETDLMVDPPAGITLPLGLFDIRIEDLPPGTGTTLTMHLSSASKFDTFYKYGATPDDSSAHWYEFTYDLDSETGAVFENDTITLYLKDGSRGDDDLTENGIVSDPAGPAILGADPTPPGSQLSDENPAGAGSSGSGGCFIDTLFMSHS